VTARKYTARSNAGYLFGLIGAVALATGLTACGSAGHDNSFDGNHSDFQQQVVGAAGWTRIATSKSYLVVANVLPGERMFTSAEAAVEHPTVGELVINGEGRPLGDDVRHVEAHIYDRITGNPLSNLSPVIVVLNRTSGVRTNVPPTLMQDVNIGAADIHYGNNISVPGDSDLSLSVVIGSEEVTVDGHLD
jgi:hypothetical protein